jgi:hypothetical protein
MVRAMTRFDFATNFKINGKIAEYSVNIVSRQAKTFEAFPAYTGTL